MSTNLISTIGNNPKNQITFKDISLLKNRFPKFKQNTHLPTGEILKGESTEISKEYITTRNDDLKYAFFYDQDIKSLIINIYIYPIPESS